MKTINDWNLHSWYRTRDGRKAWLAAIAIRPDGEPVSDWPLLFCVGNNESWYVSVDGQYRTGQPRDCDIIEPWTDESRPLGRYCPVKHPPTEADGDKDDWAVAKRKDGNHPVGDTVRLWHVKEFAHLYEWWCPLKPILEMEVQK